MISETTVSAIRHLLREGKLSQRKIALHLGVSRKAVHNVDKATLREEPKKEATFQGLTAAAIVAAPSSSCRVWLAK